MHAQTAKLLFVGSIAFALGACSVYRPEVRQGNYIEPLKFAQVKPGMTREQVRFLLGPPMIADGFHRSQWDYYFTLEAQSIKQGQVKRHFIVRFDGDVVASIEEPGAPKSDPNAPKTDTRVEKLFEEPAAAPAATPATAPVEQPAEPPVPPPAEVPAVQG
jgi:outer membrane protein assembly factor BamE